jgi:hypothetical protein
LGFISLRQRSQHLWPWLLALLLFGSVGGTLVTRIGWTGSGASCTTAAHACCCVKSGLLSCACGGHKGPAAQLASLTTCSGAKELPALVLTVVAFLLAPASVSLMPLRAVGRAANTVPSVPISPVIPPSPPPPQPA